MNKAIRVILPILLALAIILCLCWYFVVYDRELTRDLLLESARFFERQGSHKVSAWFYDLAYHQASDNDAVAIELARQHKASGNYTKAEYVLNNAIADGGGAELYIELCKTYVEQDKLFDAVKLLDAVCREDSTVKQSVKNTLIQMRPSAPTTSIAPGFYNQYMSVSIQADSAKLYVNALAEYPSINADAYSAPITLTSGENTIYAIAVADNGLVSPLSIFGYTVGGVVEPVIFSDPAIEAEVRSLLNLPSASVLLTSDLWTIKSFAVPFDAQDYTDLKHMTGLEELTVYKGRANQLHNIVGAKKLVKLTIVETPVSKNELSAIASLPALQTLTLSNCSLSTIEGLEKATGLTYLDLSENALRDLAALSSLNQLTVLNLQKNALNDLSLQALSSLPALTSLNVSYNLLSTLEPLFQVQTLTTLLADSNALTTVENIGLLTSLQEFSADTNQLTNVSALGTCTSLKKLTISNNAITDITALGSLSSLSYLNFSHNKVTKLPKWSSIAMLTRIEGSYNNISSLENLAGLPRLHTIYMDYNKNISSVNSLVNCPVLMLVSVFGTKVTNTSGLTTQGIVVHIGSAN